MNQFAKRKLKEAADLLKKTTTVESVVISQEKLEDLTVTEIYDLPPLEIKPETVLNHEAIDVYSSDGGRTYYLASIKYNVETGEAKVVETYTLPRVVALAAKQHKVGLKTLKKIKKES